MFIETVIDLSSLSDHSWTIPLLENVLQRKYEMEESLLFLSWIIQMHTWTDVTFTT